MLVYINNLNGVDIKNKLKVVPMPGRFPLERIPWVRFVPLVWVLQVLLRFFGLSD